MRLFQKLLAFWAKRTQHHLSHDPLELHFLFPARTLDELSRELVYSEIAQWIQAGLQVRVMPQQLEMPDGCIGEIRFLCGERLIWQQYLMQQEVFVPTMRLYYM